MLLHIYEEYLWGLDEHQILYILKPPGMESTGEVDKKTSVFGYC
jgi:hypothetical protein